MMRDYAENDYHHALMMLGSQSRAQLLVELAPKLSDEEVRSLLSTWWSVSESWSGVPELRDGMMALLRRVAPLHVVDPEHPRPLRSGKTLTVYRGNLGETPDAGSWTLDRKIAERFALMAISPRGMFLGMYREDGIPSIWQGKVASADILGYFDDRHEAECVIGPGSVKRIKLFAQAQVQEDD